MSDLARLRTLWHRWTACVARAAHRNRHDPIASRYGELHQELMAACRSLAESSSGSDRVFYEGMETLAKPWLTAGCLSRADAEMLADLVLRCHDVQRHLGGTPLNARLSKLARVGLCIALVVGLVLTLWVTLSYWLPWARASEGWTRVVWITVRSWTFHELWIAIAGLAVLAAVWTIGRSVRS